MPARLEAIAFDAVDAAAVATFWATLLGRDVVGDFHGFLVPGDGTQVGLRFVAAHSTQIGPRRLHLHVTSTSLDDQWQTVQTIVHLGGRHIDVGQAPDAGFIVLADPEGNELCVIEPSNNFLAGTGFLGEVTCEGTRDVGQFWSNALRWPLVWDENQETAIQAPLGGTKVSWGGPPVAPRQGRNRQRFELVTTSLGAEVDRLRLLGATIVGDLPNGVELTDPDGNEFSLYAAPTASS